MHFYAVIACQNKILCSRTVSRHAEALNVKILILDLLLSLDLLLFTYF